MFVRELAVFVSCCSVVLCFCVLADRMMMLGLMVMVRSSVVMRRSLMMMLACGMLR